MFFLTLAKQIRSLGSGFLENGLGSNGGSFAEGVARSPNDRVSEKL